MQGFLGLAVADFRTKAKVIVSKLEVFIDPDWINLCNLGGKDYLVEANYSSGQKELSYQPVAASFDATIDDTDGDFNPQNDEAQYKDHLKVGRRIRFWTGFVKNSTDYLWQWFEGIISSVRIERGSRQIVIEGFDYTQYLTEIKLKSPDNYWGTSKVIATENGVAGYDVDDEDCNGIYIAYLDKGPGYEQIYDGDTWIYDKGTKKLWFLPSKIPDGIYNLKIYYYIEQIPENVIADLLVTGGLYDDRNAALLAMDYTETEVDDKIGRVRFNAGVSIFYAIQKICERVDYEFFFTYNSTPIFKPIS